MPSPEQAHFRLVRLRLGLIHGALLLRGLLDRRGRKVGRTYLNRTVGMTDVAPMWTIAVSLRCPSAPKRLPGTELTSATPAMRELPAATIQNGPELFERELGKVPVFPSSARFWDRGARIGEVHVCQAGDLVRFLASVVLLAVLLIAQDAEHAFLIPVFLPDTSSCALFVDVDGIEHFLHPLRLPVARVHRAEMRTDVEGEVLLTVGPLDPREMAWAEVTSTF